MLNQGQCDHKLDVLEQCPSHKNKKTCILCQNRQEDRECSCPMCTAYIAKRYSPSELSLQEQRSLLYEKITNKVESKLSKRKIPSWPLEYILKKMLPPPNKTIVHTFGLFIAETCFYKDGEAHSLFLNSQTVDKGPGIREPAVIRIKKQKLTNTQIQKILNQKRRKYRQKVGTLRKYQRKASEFGKKQAPPETKDAIVICTNNKDESYEQLHEQNYFIGLMLRRKQDPVFKHIEFIKNFIGVGDEDKRVFFCKHQEGKTKYPELLSRSRTLMRVYASNILATEQSYISAEDQSIFLQTLSTSNPDSYAYYTLYKIISYIQTFYDERITLISMKFLLNQLNELYLLHVYNLQKEDLVKYAWTEQTYIKKIAEGEEKMMRRLEMKPKVDFDHRSRNRSALIQDHMKGEYEHMKFVMGLAHVQKDDEEEKNNNQFFKKIHPEIETPISEILKDKTMTVHKFKHKYLGQSRNKKPVAAEFNSNLVKILHKLTPRLRVAPGHEIEDKQLQRPMGRGIWSVVGKRSMSQGNTISTMNKTTTIFL